MHMPRSIIKLACATVTLISVALVQDTKFLRGDEAIIDSLVANAYQSLDRRPANVCDDQTFVRRVYLDLVGRVPTTTERQTFLNDGREDARTHLVDLLLYSREHAVYMARVFDSVLMGRKENKLGGRFGNGWIKYLEQVFESNRPWHEVAQEILLARETDGGRGHLWYLYEREDKHQEIAESIATGFFGIDIACAQCHDHPLADEIGQQHYWGLVAFFKRSKNEKNEQGISIAESAVGGFDNYANALDGSSDESTLTFLDRETVAEIRPEDPAKQEDSDALYLITESGAKIPKFSRREKFVEEVLTGHPRLARAMVNRLWGLFVGRGLVHPINEMDSMHPASHPELLAWLAEDFEQHNYDIRRLMRLIILSNVYQLETHLASANEKPTDPSQLLVGNLKALTAEQMLDSIRVALDLTQDQVRPIAADLRKQFPEVIPANESSSLQQALYLSNDDKLNELVATAAARLIQSNTENDLLIENLFLRIFGRPAANEETAAIQDYLESQLARGTTDAASSRERAVADIIWAMLTSAEFRFNH